MHLCRFLFEEPAIAWATEAPIDEPVADWVTAEQGAIGHRWARPERDCC